MTRRYELDYTQLATRIKSARLTAGYSQAKLAELVGVSVNTIAKLEINYTTISLKTILNIANALEVDINYLVSSTPPNHKQANDLFIESLLQDFTDHDKELVIHIISAVKAHLIRH